MTLKKVHQIIDTIENEIKQKDDSIQNIMLHVNPYK